MISSHYFESSGAGSPVLLHYLQAGEKGKPLMLFLHGFPQSAFVWEPYLANFAKDFCCVAPDLRGVNLSSKPAGVAAYHAKHIVADILELAAYFSSEPFVLVAHDWGGAAAWNIGVRASQRLAKLIIVNSPHPAIYGRALVNDSEQQKASEYMNWLRQAGSETALAKDNFALLEGFFNGMGQGAANWLTPAVKARYHDMWAQPSGANSHSLEGAVNYYRATPMHPPSAREPGPAAIEWRDADWTVKAKTLVIWAIADLALRPVLLEGLENCVPDLTIRKIEHANHWVLDSHAPQCIALMEQFV